MRRKYTLDEDVFNKIDNEEKAYWLGFLYADGYITRHKQGQFVLGLKQKEFEILQLFCKFLKTNKPIYEFTSNNGYNKGKKYFQVLISSNKIVNDLRILGIFEKKSLELKFPNINQVPKEFINHFIRGYFDGDGSVFHFKSKRKNKTYIYLGVSICGTKEFLDELKENLPFITKKESIIFKDKRKTTNCYKIKLETNKRANAFYNFVYNNCTIFLERKRKTFNDYNGTILLEDDGIV